MCLQIAICTLAPSYCFSSLSTSRRLFAFTPSRQAAGFICSLHTGETAHLFFFFLFVLSCLNVCDVVCPSARMCTSVEFSLVCMSWSTEGHTSLWMQDLYHCKMIENYEYTCVRTHVHTHACTRVHTHIHTFCRFTNVSSFCEQHWLSYNDARAGFEGSRATWHKAGQSFIRWSVFDTHHLKKSHCVYESTLLATLQATMLCSTVNALHLQSS